MSKIVKFTYERTRAGLASFKEFGDLNACRRSLVELRLMGVDSNGVSFGNLSVRDDKTANFYITGSGTGGISDLTPADCTKVVAYDFERNSVKYEGVGIPSSESLTHAAIYESATMIGAVIHCHDLTLWLMLLDRVSTSSKAVAYGTPEMAFEIMRLFKAGDVQGRKILIMGGHEGGVVTFGRDLEEAFTVLMHERSSLDVSQLD